MKMKIITVGVLVACAAAIFGISYYLKSGPENSDSEIAQNDEHKAKDENKDIIQEQAHPDTAMPEHHEENRGAVADTENGQKEQPSNHGGMNDPAMKARLNEMQERAIKEQIPRLYADLFKELSLSEGQKEKVVAHLSKSMQSEAQFGMKLLDPDVPVEEVLREQEKLSRDLREDMKDVLPDREQELIKNYQNNLPKKMQKKQLFAVVDGLNLDAKQKEDARGIIDRAVENMKAKKGLGQFAREDIVEMREKFRGAKLGDQQFMKATIEVAKAQNESLLKNLKDLPKDAYNAIEKQQGAPLEAMEQMLKMNPPDNPQ